MRPLRLGVVCAVIDDEGRLLLSRRSDLNVWTLPGGRLDMGERLAEAAARETHEETGLVVHVDRAVGLYYLAGWRRLNVLYSAWPLGGELRQRSVETRANQFFAAASLPDMPLSIIALDALAGTRHLPRVISTPPRELRRVQGALRWRWVKNRVMGRPEPAFPRFDVRAVAVIWNEGHQRVLTLRGKRGRVLPRVVCHGDQAPWETLAQAVETACRATPSFRWVGLWQHPTASRIEFVFAATVIEASIGEVGEWSLARTAALPDQQAAYVERVGATYAHDPVWTLEDTAGVQPGDIITLDFTGDDL